MQLKVERSAVQQNDPNGAVVSGPSPRGLTWHAVSLSKDGRLVVDMDQAVTHDKNLVIKA